MTYDVENRLTQAGSLLTAAYRADGLRAWKDNGTTRTYFLYDGGLPVVEMNSSGTVTAKNVYGPDGLVARHNGSAWTEYVFDQQGNVAQRLNTSQVEQSSAAYDGYGVESSSGSPSDPFGYNAQWGYYLDRETGLYACMFRYYDPGQGRWLNRDPIGYAGGVNVYGYCGGGPLGYIDPSGLDFLSWGSNFFGGWGDALTFGLTDIIREGLGVNGQVDKDSGWYRGGTAVGTIHGTAIMPAGKGVPPGTIPVYANGGAKGAHSSYQAARSMRGRRGGQDHRDTVKDCEDSLGQKGHESGGSFPEELDKAARRYPDLGYSGPNGKQSYQIGRTNKDGTPSWREWQAGGDLADAGHEVFFVPILGLP